MYYYADVYTDTDSSSAQRWTYTLHEKSSKGWVKLQLIRIDIIENDILMTHTIQESDIDDIGLLFSARSKMVNDKSTYLLNIPNVERGIRIALTPTPEIVELTLTNIIPVIFYGNGLP